MPTSVPVWLFASQAALTVMLGAVVAAAAWRQWRTAHDKALLDVFEKRFALYRQLKEVLGTAFSDAGASRLLPFFGNRDEFRMLFGDDAVDFERECQIVIGELELLQARLRQSSTDEAARRAERAAVARLSDLMARTETAFSPYLRITFRNERPSAWRSVRIFLLGR
jgi:hypothetical protein